MSLVSYSAEIMAVTRREVRIVARVMAAQVAVTRVVSVFAVATSAPNAEIDAQPCNLLPELVFPHR